MDHLYLSVKLCDPHVICITESWFSGDILDDELSMLIDNSCLVSTETAMVGES